MAGSEWAARVEEGRMCPQISPFSADEWNKIFHLLQHLDDVPEVEET
jgi:hypothetical protein